jgi:hypothetical protein
MLMRRSCHRQNAYRSDLFQPLPPTPTWDSLSLPVVRKVIEVLAQILDEERRRRRMLAMVRKEVGDE